MQTILVAYDIPDDDRRQKIAGLLEDYGIRLQKSLFACRLFPAARESLMSALEQIMDPEADSVRFYPFCERCWKRRIVWGRKSVLEECGPVLFL